MNILLFLAYFLFGSVAVKKLSNVSLLSIPFILFAFAVLMLYLFGITGNLEVGYYLCIGAAIVSGAYACTLNRKISFSVDEVVGVLIALIPFVWLYISIDSDFLFTGWDEFSFWGASIKIISATDALYNNGSPLSYAFKSYPPAQQLLQYFFVKSFGWKESTVLLAHGFFILSSLLFTAATLVQKRTSAASLAFLISIPTIYYFGFDFGHIFVDQLLAVVFAASIACALRKDTLHKFILLPATLFLLVEIKQMGLVFALFALFIAILNEIISLEIDISFRLKKAAAVGVTGLVSILASYKTWIVYLSTSGVVPVFQSDRGVERLWSDDNRQLALTLKELVKRLDDPTYFQMGGQLFSGMTIVTITLILSVASLSLILFSIKNKTEICNSLVFSVSMIVLWPVYVVFLLLCYLMFFSEYESIRLASFERYTATFLLAWIVSFISLTARLFTEKTNIFVRAVLCAMIISCIIFIPEQFYKDASNITSNDKWIKTRVNVKKFTDDLMPMMKNGDKAYFIQQQSRGFEKNIFNYSVLPHAANTWCWTLGKKYFESDVWTCDYDINQVTKGYSYLVIFTSDQQFWDNNSKYFKNWSGKVDETGIYKISRNDEGIAEIVKVK